MAYSFTVPGEANYGFIRHLIVLVTGVMKFLQPAFYCRSWAPWWRMVITVVVVVVLVVELPLVGQLLTLYTHGTTAP